MDNCDLSVVRRHSRASNLNLRAFMRDVKNNWEQISESKDFESIFSFLSYLTSKYCGLGQLACYDTATSICKELDLPIPNIYLCGYGPRMAVHKLKLPTKSKQLGMYEVKFVDLMTVCKALDRKGVDYRKAGIKSTQLDADPMESFLCRNRKKF